MKTKTKKLKSEATHSHKLRTFHKQLKQIEREREQYIKVYLIIRKFCKLSNKFN